MTYKFSSVNGTEVEVEAKDEYDARHAAMVKLWGWPNHTWASGRYYGRGLSLIGGNNAATKD